MGWSTNGGPPYGKPMTEDDRPRWWHEQRRKAEADASRAAAAKSVMGGRRNLQDAQGFMEEIREFVGDAPEEEAPKGRPRRR
jgi:hypothetical protein